MAKLGFRREFETMIEHTKEAVPDLRSIVVTLEDRYDLGDEPVVLISAEVPDPGSGGRPDPEAVGSMGHRDASTPTSIEHFCFMLAFGTDADGR